ncbi:hypothetical protein D3C79_217490 [compost metagenome]
MPVIGTHRDRPTIARLMTPLLLAEDRLDHRNHIHVALQMGPLMETLRILFAAGGAQVGEMDTVAEGVNHPYQVIIRTHAVRPGAHGETVIEAIDGLLQPLHILNGRHDTRQAEDRPRRIVRMHRQTHTYFLRHRHNGAQEHRHIFAQLRLVDRIVLRKAGAELI